MADPQNTPAQRTRSSDARDAREDGRRQFLLYLQPALIERIKMAAIAAKKPSYIIVEAFLTKYIDQIEEEAHIAQSGRRMDERSQRKKAQSE